MFHCHSFFYLLAIHMLVVVIYSPAFFRLLMLLYITGNHNMYFTDLICIPVISFLFYPNNLALLSSSFTLAIILWLSKTTYISLFKNRTPLALWRSFSTCTSKSSLNFLSDWTIKWLPFISRCSARHVEEARIPNIVVCIILTIITYPQNFHSRRVRPLQLNAINNYDHKIKPFWASTSPFRH